MHCIFAHMLTKSHFAHFNNFTNANSIVTVALMKQKTSGAILFILHTLKPLHKIAKRKFLCKTHLNFPNARGDNVLILATVSYNYNAYSKVMQYAGKLTTVAGAFNLHIRWPLIAKIITA